MFSSNNSINPFCRISQSNFLPSPLFCPENENNNSFSLPQQNDEDFQNPNKKGKRKDRHSKIHTARGLRDRRVRLSIDISRKFFKLQDMLGFEKGSETISWLLESSQSSIKELEHKEFSKDKGLEKISPISELSEWQLGTSVVPSVKDTIVNIKPKKINKQSRASIYCPTRESRTRARERARERTREKILSIQKTDDPNPSISTQYNNLVSEIEAYAGMVGDMINGSPAYLKSENPLITREDWDKNLFSECEVYSKSFETCYHSGSLQP